LYRTPIPQAVDAGGEKRAGDYNVGFDVEEAEGMYQWTGGGFQWSDHGDSMCMSRRRFVTPPTGVSFRA